MNPGRENQEPGEANEASPSVVLEPQAGPTILSGNEMPDMDASSITPYVQPTLEQFATEQAAQTGLLLDPELMKQAAAATISQQQAGTVYTLAQAKKAEAEANLINSQAEEKQITNRISAGNEQHDLSRRNVAKGMLVSLGILLIIVPLVLYIFFVVRSAQEVGRLEPEMLVENVRILIPCLIGVAFLMGEKFITGGILLAVVTTVVPLFFGKGGE